MAEAQIRALFGEDFRVENMVYVAKNGDDANIGTEEDPFLTIQAAIDYAVSLGVIWLGGRVLITVNPGIYTEQLKSYQGIYISGVIQNVSTSEGGAVTLYNTGADADHYPLSGEDNYDFWLKNITVQTDPGGVFGKLSNSRFNTVSFVGGEFIERSQDIALYCIWKNCSFLSCVGFNLTGVAPQGRYLVFIDCWFGWWKTMRFESTHTVGNAVFDMEGGHLAFTQVMIKGDWYHFAKNYHSFGAYRHEFDTTKGISFRHVTISNGMHFFSDPMNFQMIGCEMTDAAEMPIPVDAKDITADVPITDCVFVNNAMHNGIDGNIQIRGTQRNVGVGTINRYFSIQDAIDSLPSGGMIFLQPATYEEQIHSKANITIQGLTQEGTPAKKATTIYNTGADADHYPLRGGDDDYYVINDVTIETDLGGVIGKLGTYNFSGCVLSRGHFIEATQNKTLFITFDECTFLETQAFDLTGVGTGGARLMTIVDCFFAESAINSKFDSTNAVTLLIIKNCVYHRHSVDIGGDWKCEVSDCHLFNTQRTNISTTNKVTFLQCIISCGLHFTSNPEAMIQLCTFNDDCGYLITGPDITATVPVTNIDYAQNVQQNGVCGNIQTLCPIKNVGCHSIDRYYTLQDAISSIQASGKAVIRIWEDITALAKLVMVNTGTHITIDGSKKYKLTFTGDIVDIVDNQHFGFIDMVSVEGGTIHLNGATAELSLGSNRDILSDVVIDAGAFAIVDKTSLFGSAGNPGITMNSLTTALLLEYSKVGGDVGQPALEINALCDDQIKIKFSSLISGTPLTIAPLTYTGVGKVDIAVYNTGLSGSWNPADVTNTIGSPNLTTDPNIIF